MLRDRNLAVGAQRPLQVIDLGGGTGGLAVRVAELGHHVVVVDPSPDALASLERRAAEASVSASVRGVVGDAATLLDVVQPASADVVICHGVLEVVDDPALALTSAATALVEGGCLSVLAAQRSAAVFTRAITGHLAEARALLQQHETASGNPGSVPRRFSPDELHQLLASAHFTVTEMRGVRVFTDHIASTMVESQPGASEELRALEAAVATDPDFMAMATQLHLLATRR
ncbi:MAG: methyltransferase domain-containing protein [Nocardioidaceae bacterium]|nr:methyltransferase domain-containing protein [Nocardioidaceae bacterium]